MSDMINDTDINSSDDPNAYFNGESDTNDGDIASDKEDKNGDRAFIREQIRNIGELLAMTDADGKIIASNRELLKEYRDMLRDYTVNTQQTVEKDDIPEQPTMKYVMSRIDKLIAANDEFKASLSLYANWNVNESPMGGEGDAARAKGIAESIKAREETNRRIIDFLQDMYDDLKPVKAPSELVMKNEMLEKLLSMLKDTESESYEEAIKRAIREKR